MKKILEKQGFKLYRDSEWNEYVVKHPTNKNAHYHTDDKDDAIATMDRMIAEDEDTDKCSAVMTGQHSYVQRDDDPELFYCEYCGEIES